MVAHTPTPIPLSTRRTHVITDSACSYLETNKGSLTTVATGRGGCAVVVRPRYPNELACGIFGGKQGKNYAERPLSHPMARRIVRPVPELRRPW